MKHSDSEIAEAARDFFTTYSNSNGTICGLENFQKNMAKMHAMVDPSPLPTDEDLCKAAGWIDHKMCPRGTLIAYRKICGHTLTMAEERATQRLQEPGWQLEDFAVELADLAEEMEKR